MGPKQLWVVVLLSVLSLEAGWSNGCLEQERLAFSQLEPFFSHLPQEEGSDCCQWEWVECNITSGRVTKLSLNHTNRRGDSRETWYLDTNMFLPFEELRSLYLDRNQIAGFVENEGFGKRSKLSRLEILDLSHNFFNNSALSKLSGFSNLKSLDISFNQLKGSIDIKEFCGLSNLESLDMSYNEVNQFVTSKEKGCLRELKVLYLDGLSTKQNISLVSLLEPFSSVKTLSLRDNSYLNKTVVTQELHVLRNLEDLLLDNTHVDSNFLKSIGSLTSLKTLSLYNCSLAGTLPSLGWCYLKSLEELRLNGNALEGDIDSCLGNLTFLRFLDISDNQFTGNIASSPLTNLTKLQYLSLSNNSFQIPLSFKSFANHSNLKLLLSDGNKLVDEPGFHTLSPKFQLQVFNLSMCSMEGDETLKFPNFLYHQYDLRYIDLSHNNFGGIGFPNWLIENNTRLEALYMTNSTIVGPLFLQSQPSPNLKVIDISNNTVQRQIPMNFCSNFPNLEGLFVSRNAIESNIPLCLGNMGYLTHLDMSQNRFFGAIPEELAKSRSLRFLRVSNNFLSGKIFPAKYRSDRLEGLYLDGNNFDGDIPSFSPFSSSVLKTLVLSDNNLSGKLPRWLGSLTTLETLALGGNQLEGPIPIELCNMVNLEILNLSHNHLSGNIPSCSNLQNIKHVYLSGNKLSGSLSHAFFRSSSLVILDLSKNNFTGKIPDWNNTLPALTVLLLKANQFHGELPKHLCKLYSIRILDLSLNKFSGSIPSCLKSSTLRPRREKFDTRTSIFRFNVFDRVLGGMGQKIYDLITLKDEYSSNGFPTTRSHPLKYEGGGIQITYWRFSLLFKVQYLYFFSVIDLSCNQLTGVIPPGLGNLSEVRSLNLSHNNLTGPIPSTFSKFMEIESLDLSYNNLNGRMSPKLTDLTFLSAFSVAYNNFSGQIPSGNQFSTFDESSYEGNPFLCGFPLKTSCSTEGDSPETPSGSSMVLDYFKLTVSMYSFLLLLLLIH